MKSVTAHSISTRKYCLSQEQNKIRDKSLLISHDYVASLTRQPAPETYFDQHYQIPSAPPEILALVEQKRQSDTRQGLDIYLQCMLALGSIARQNPLEVKSALQSSKLGLQDLHTPGEKDIKKKAAGITMTAQLIAMMDSEWVTNAVGKTSLFIDICGSGFDSKTYEILSSVRLLYKQTMKLILASVRKCEKLYLDLIQQTSYLERVYLVLMSQKTDLILAAHALEHLLALLSSEFGLASRETSKKQTQYLEAIAVSVFEFTKLSTKKFAILGFKCLQKMVPLIPLCAVLAQEIESFCVTIEDTFFAHPIEEIQRAAGSLYLQILKTQVHSIDHKPELVERALQHFNYKSHKLSALNCQLLMVLLKKFNLEGKLIVNQILHMAVSSLEVMKSGSGMYVTHAWIFDIILQSFKSLSEKDYQVFIKTQGQQVARELIETMDTIKEKQGIVEAVHTMKFLLKNGNVSVKLEGMEQAMLILIIEKLMITSKTEMGKELEEILEICCETKKNNETGSMEMIDI